MAKILEKEPEGLGDAENCLCCGKECRTWYRGYPLCYTCSRKYSADELPTFYEYVDLCNSNETVWRRK